MATFKTRDGKEWAVAITIGHLKPLRETCGFEPAKAIADPAQLSALMLDGERLVQILYVLCEDQIQKAGLTPEAFGMGFDGPAIEKAVEALLGGIVDFFPRSRVAARAREHLMTSFGRMDEMAIARIDAAMAAASTPSGSAGNSGGPSA